MSEEHNIKYQTEKAIVWWLEQLFSGPEALCQYTIISADEDYNTLEKTVIPEGTPLDENSEDAYGKSINRMLALIRVYKKHYGLEDTRKLIKQEYAEKLDNLGYKSKLDRLLERNAA